MSQNSTMPNSNYHSMVMLGDAAWTLLANQPIDQIDIDVVADTAGIDRGLAGALAGSVQSLVLAKMSELDRQSLTETYGEIQDAGEVNINRKNISDEILNLNKLKEDGILSEEEYEKAKKKLLD